MSNRYYIEYPRDFANEYIVYVVAAERAAELEAKLPDAERITRAEAIERGIRRPRQAKRYNEQWWGSLAESIKSRHQQDRDMGGDALTDSDLLYHAASATADILDGVEA